MVILSKNQELVYNIKLSSVGPGRVTGSDVVYEPNAMDLAMKLHYIKGVYFFSSQACQGLTILRIKETMFPWFNDYYMTCGRFRRQDDTGRPYVKCNDCGARFIEAQCDKTVGEWLDMRDYSLDKFLVYHLPIGPELFFSPLLYIQVTKFRCGGMSLGLSWAHVLGDAFSVSDFISVWGQFMAELKAYGPLNIRKSVSLYDKCQAQCLYAREPLSLKRVNPVGDHWLTANNCKMETFSFHLTGQQVSHLHSKTQAQNKSVQIPIFEALSAIMWQCIAKVKVKDGFEPTTVTVCKKNPNDPVRNGILSNSTQVIKSVRADFGIVDSDLEKLAVLLVDQALEENTQIEELVERDNGVCDYIVYGANLTFVDLEGANLYGVEWNGHKPEFVNYSIQGVGDEGAVLILPGPKDSGKDGNNGRMVTVTLPENEVVNLKLELEKNGIMLLRDDID